MPSQVRILFCPPFYFIPAFRSGLDPTSPLMAKVTLGVGRYFLNEVVIFLGEGKAKGLAEGSHNTSTGMRI